MGKVIELFYKVKGGKKMANVFDVANYFIYCSVNDKDIDNDEALNKEKVTHLKLQKLCFYAQAWSLVWNDKELFNGQFEAWIHGPVNPELYRRYSNKGSQVIEEVNTTFNTDIFSKEELYVLDMTWKNYGLYTAKALERMTHKEDPWKITRGDLLPYERSEEIIDQKLIKKYYSQFS